VGVFSLLGSFAERDLVRLRREQVEVIDGVGLKQLAEGKN
jgi:hypothetical protein